MSEKFKVSSIPSANDGVLSVKPEHTIQEATSLMMAHDYSQVPVMTTPRSVKGILSWKSLSYVRQFGKAPDLVKDGMDTKVRFATLTDRLLPTIKKIRESEYVLVKNKREEVCGICTLYDIGDLFILHSEPFIEIEQIELALRELIRDFLSSDDIEKIKELSGMPKEAAGVDDLTFGGYILWLGDASNWDSLSLNFDRRIFIDRLRQINRIRNELMHFRSERLPERDLEELKKFSQLLRRAEKIRSL